jgi:hypothetical protein
MARDGHVTLAQVERLTGRHPQLLADQVDAGHGLGDRVLDLEAGVDLEEPELGRLVVDEELDGAGRLVAHRPAEPQRGVAHRRPQVVGHEGRRGLLDDLLVAPLDGALPLPQVDQATVGITEDLDLDVAGTGHVALEEDPVVAEGARRLALRGRDRLTELSGRVDDAHALAAAPGRGLDQEGEADLVAGGRVGRRRQGRHLGRHRGLLGRELVAHPLDDVGCGAHPHEAGPDDGPGEVGVLGEEPVAGMDRPGAGAPGRLDHGLAVEVAAGQAHGLVGIGDEGCVGVRVDEDRHRAQPHGAGRAEHPPGDLPPVGHQHRREPPHAAPHPLPSASRCGFRTVRSKVRELATG